MILKHAFTPLNNNRLSNLCGPMDAHLRTLELALQVKIAHRHEQFKVDGHKARATRAMEKANVERARAPAPQPIVAAKPEREDRAAKATKYGSQTMEILNAPDAPIASLQRFFEEYKALEHDAEVVVEEMLGPADAILTAPRHPYTAALLASQPSTDPDARLEEAPLTGDPPNPINPPSGCTFHPRCPFANDRCKAEVPVFRDGVACHAVEEGRLMPGGVAAVA